MNKNSKLNPILKKCRKIKLVLTDVDGVLTDGGMYYSEKGELLKKFNTRDGMAVELLQKWGIKTIFISKENSQIIKKRCHKVNAIPYIGIQKKELELPNICKRFDVKTNEIVYVGDDINDIEIMKLVGFKATPQDGTKEVKKLADYVCKLKGGKGAFREVADLIIFYKKGIKN